MSVHDQQLRITRVHQPGLGNFTGSRPGFNSDQYDIIVFGPVFFAACVGF